MDAVRDGAAGPSRDDETVTRLIVFETVQLAAGLCR